MLQEALNRFTLAGVDVSSLSNVSIRITDLAGTTPGMAEGNTIWLDVNGAGHGWFVDLTPGEDSEFFTARDQGEQDQMDLLTVIAHELGHSLGYGHSDQGLMQETLGTGIRELDPDLFQEMDVLPEYQSDSLLPTDSSSTLNGTSPCPCGISGVMYRF